MNFSILNRVVLAAGFVLGSSALLWSLSSPDYDPEKNDFFTTFHPTGAVVRNTSGNFVGAGYDWSGMVMFAGTDEAGYWSVGQRGFVSPVHIALAGHTSVISGVNPNVVTTMTNERSTFSTSSIRTKFPGLGTYLNTGFDLALGSIGMHVAPDAGLASYAVPDFADYTGREIFVTGHGGQNSVNSSRVMIQQVAGWGGGINGYDTSIYTSFSDTAFAQVQSEGGDSGNAIYLGYEDPAGNKQLLLLGVTSGRNPQSKLNYYSVYGSTAGINASNDLMATNGFALKLVGESATSWTGTDSGDFGTATNWTAGAPVAANYVTFDSAASATQVVDLGGSEREMRGVVFNPGAAGEGFTFQNGTLLLGRGGLANFSAETQTFAASIRLTSHQVWDATSGGFLAQNGVDLNGKLLVVQGAEDTVIEGAVSDSTGTGSGFTKYGLGKLTLKSAATYNGTTWLYGGTLALEENGELPTNTALVLGNNDTSRLELNGKSLTLTRMVTSESITGGQGTVDLGAGGKVSLYKSANSGQDVFAARFTGGTAGTIALEIGGWQSSASVSNSFWLTGASDHAGQTVLKGQIGGEGSGNGLVMRIANTQALGAWGVGNETIIRYTDVSKPYVRLVAGGTYQETLILDVAASSSLAFSLESPDAPITLAGDIVVSRNLAGNGNQRVDVSVVGNTTVSFGAIRGELGVGGVAASGSSATTLWMFANDAGSVARLNGEIADGTIAGAGTRGLALRHIGAGRVEINHANSYTGATAVASVVVANVDALSGQDGAFGNAATAVTIGGTNSTYAQGIFAGNGVTIGRDISVSASHLGGLALGAENNANAFFSGNVSLRRQADLNAGTGSQVTFSGSLQHVSGTSAITKTGAGTVILSGNNTHTGGTTVNEGTLRVQNNNALGITGTVSVNATGTLVVDTGITVANTGLTLNGGTLINHGVVNGLSMVSGTVGGRGLYNVAMGFDSAATDILAPGASIGTTSFGVSQTWAGLNYQWEIQDFTDGAPAGTAFDNVAIAGALDLSGNAYSLEVLPLDALGNTGAVPNYAADDRQWTILTTSGGISGFNASEWTINAGAFTTYHPGGQFTLSQNGNDLVLAYSPIPEPTLLGLLAAASTLLLRRRRAAQS